MPDIYFAVLRDCGALAVLFPELEALFSATDGQTGYDILTATLLRRTVLLTDSTDIRFAALCLYLSCHSTAEETAAIQKMSERLRVPNPHGIWLCLPPVITGLFMTSAIWPQTISLPCLIHWMPAQAGAHHSVGYPL